EQAWPQLPQLLLLDLVSMQLPLQSCWPAMVQVQEPPLQEEPPLQTEQLDPQWAESVFELQALSLHIVLPEPHPVDDHEPLLQTWPVLHLLPQLRQLSVFDGTQEPLHESRPLVQLQLPFWQLVPLLQVLPHPPQFWLSVWVSTQELLHDVCPELQVGDPLVP